MAGKVASLNVTGPFRADQLKSGDPYELSKGHPIACLPVGGRGSRANLLGGAVLDSDPDVDSAGVDTGFALAPETLRAPDVAVGNVTDTPGWVTGAAPPLAVEYADTGQDEAELAAKVADLLAGGTRLVWIVRLVGPRRVEVHAPGVEMRLAYPDEALEAPGILRNSVPVAALFDRDAAHEVTLRNLLQRRGYRDLQHVREDGKAEGKAEGKVEGKAEGNAEGKASTLKRQMTRRFGTLPSWAEQRIDAAAVAQLDEWLDGIFDAATVEALIGPELT